MKNFILYYSLVCWCESDRSLSEAHEGVPSPVLALELVGGEELGPVLLGDQVLDLLPAHVDAVVEVAAPEHVVMGKNMATLKVE